MDSCTTLLSSGLPQALPALKDGFPFPASREARHTSFQVQTGAVWPWVGLLTSLASVFSVCKVSFSFHCCDKNNVREERLILAYRSTTDPEGQRFIVAGTAQCSCPHKAEQDGGQGRHQATKPQSLPRPQRLISSTQTTHPECPMNSPNGATGGEQVFKLRGHFTLKSQQ